MTAQSVLGQLALACESSACISRNEHISGTSACASPLHAWSACPYISPRSVSIIPLRLPCTRVAQAAQVASADMLRLGCGWTSAKKGTSFLCMAEMSQDRKPNWSGLTGTDHTQLDDGRNTCPISFPRCRWVADWSPHVHHA